MDSENSIAVLAVRQRGADIASLISEKLGAKLFVKQGIKKKNAVVFDDLKETFIYLFENYRYIVSIMACGIAVRMISGLPKSKYKDPAVVVIDEGARYAVSLLSGHEGGANSLAYGVCSIIGCKPVVTTATEATKRFVVGIGSRRGVQKNSVVYAVREAAQLAGITVDDIRVIASCWYKENEKGLRDAAEEIGLDILFLPKFLYDNELYNFKTTKAFKYLGIKNVAEASALLAAANPKIVLEKTIFNDVTVSIVEEGLINI